MGVLDLEDAEQLEELSLVDAGGLRPRGACDALGGLRAVLGCGP